MKLEILEKKIKACLPPKRFAHSLSVARLASAWASGLGVRPERAYAAGLLHDCARGLTHEQQRKLLAGYRGKFFDRATRACPALWHNPAGVFLARHRYGVHDTGILRAVALHSTGAARMGLLEKIIFVADYCEPLRQHAGIAGIRKLAEKNLDAAVAAVARAKSKYLQQRGERVHPNCLAVLK